MCTNGISRATNGRHARSPRSLKLTLAKFQGARSNTTALIVFPDRASGQVELLGVAQLGHGLWQLTEASQGCRGAAGWWWPGGAWCCRCQRVPGGRDPGQTGFPSAAITWGRPHRPTKAGRQAGRLSPSYRPDVGPRPADQGRQQRPAPGVGQWQGVAVAVAAALASDQSVALAQAPGRALSTHSGLRPACTQQPRPPLANRRAPGLFNNSSRVPWFHSLIPFNAPHPSLSSSRPAASAERPPSIQLRPLSRDYPSIQEGQLCLARRRPSFKHRRSLPPPLRTAADRRDSAQQQHHHHSQGSTTTTALHPAVSALAAPRPPAPPRPHRLTSNTSTQPTSAMATRGPPGARGMSNRFAQFKLVLLGEMTCIGG